MEPKTHAGRRAQGAQAHDTPGIDPGVALLLAGALVLVALALGPALYLLLPAAF